MARKPKGVSEVENPILRELFLLAYGKRLSASFTDIQWTQTTDLFVVIEIGKRLETAGGNAQNAVRSLCKTRDALRRERKDTERLIKRKSAIYYAPHQYSLEGDLKKNQTQRALMDNALRVFKQQARANLWCFCSLLRERRPKDSQVHLRSCIYWIPRYKVA